MINEIKFLCQKCGEECDYDDSQICSECEDELFWDGKIQCSACSDFATQVIMGVYLCKDCNLDD